MTVSVPDRSLEQRRAALARANQVRVARAGLKRDIRTERQSVADIVRDPPEVVRGMSLAELLLAVPKVGPYRLNRLLNEHRVSPVKTVGGLSGRQREALVRSLGGWPV